MGFAFLQKGEMSRGKERKLGHQIKQELKDNEKEEGILWSKLEFHPWPRNVYREVSESSAARLHPKCGKRELGN